MRGSKLAFDSWPCLDESNWLVFHINMKVQFLGECRTKRGLGTREDWKSPRQLLEMMKNTVRAEQNAGKIYKTQLKSNYVT